MYKPDQRHNVNESNQTLKRPGDYLYEAAESGDAEKVKQILASHGHNFFDCYTVRNGNNALHIAFLNKHDKVVDVVLDALHAAKSYKNIQNRTNLTHLHIACTRKNRGLIEGILRHGGVVKPAVGKDSPAWAGYTALHFAAKYQSLPAMRALLNAGFDPRSKDATGKTALDLACETFVVAGMMVDLLEEEGSQEQYRCHPMKLQRKNFSNFLVSCLNDNKDVVQEFINGGADLNSRTKHELSIPALSYPLHLAVASNSRKKVGLLLKNGADIQMTNEKNMTPLHLALYYAELKIFNKRKVPQKYDVSIIDMLYEAVRDKMVNSEDSNGLNLFHIAIERNDMDTVKQYLEEGRVDVNKSLSCGAGDFAEFTPLHFTVHFQRPEIAELLIQHGADVNVSSRGHGTPCHMAFNAGAGGHSFAKLFMTANAKLDTIAPSSLKTMLHFIVQHVTSGYYLSDRDQDNKLSKESVIEYIHEMVRLGVDVNGLDEKGETPLHYFRSQKDGWTDYFQLLLDLGADINIRNHADELPFCALEWRKKQLKRKANTIFYHHVQKLKALGLEVDPDNDQLCWQFLEDDDDERIEKEEMFGREQQRLEEIERLKGTTIGDGTTLYDFIRMDNERAMAHKDSKALKDVAEDEELRKKFPSYAYLVLLRYRDIIGYYGDGARKRKHSGDDGDVPIKQKRFE